MVHRRNLMKKMYVDKHYYKTFTDKHGDTYSVPQRRLWARTLHCGTHDSFETPPPLPMFGPPPKRPKKDRDSLAESITNAAVAITKAFSPPTSTAQQPEQSQQAPLNLNPPSIVMSPGKCGVTNEKFPTTAFPSATL